MKDEKFKSELRKILHETSQESHKFLEIKDMKVNLVSCPSNIFRIMVNASCSTWNRDLDKWSKFTPESRFKVVKAVLEKHALPLAAEFPKFTFEVQNISRKMFDHAVRTRMASYSSMGTKDDDMSELNFILSTKICENKEAKELVIKHLSESKKLYKKMQSLGLPNWTCAHILPMSMAHNYIFAMDYLNLQNFCGNRMETTEEEGINLLAWKIRKEIKDKVSPLLANYLRPRSDFARKDLNLDYNGFSREMEDIPHTSDNRWVKNEDERKFLDSISKFKEPCTDIKKVELALGEKIPEQNDWINYTWETLDEKDRKLFESD